jgi:hypothetical protein
MHRHDVSIDAPARGSPIHLSARAQLVNEALVRKSDASSPQELSGTAAHGVLLTERSYRDAFDAILTGL